MKTPKIEVATIQVSESIAKADFVPRHQTRGFAASLRAFSYKGAAPLANLEQREKRGRLSEDESSLSSLGSDDAFDIEDEPLRISSTRKRKRGFNNPSTAVTSFSTATSTRTSTREEDFKGEISAAKKLGKVKRQPAKRIVNKVGEEETEPPANWEEIYEAVREMRKERLAPVDTMGCETLAEEHATPRDKRFQTLIALMLSSQTKDTTNAIAMRRLHTELPSPGLTLENILEVDPVKLNEMIFVVGFHNNKTRYIKAAALILRDEYDGDIPDTIEGLMRLPGVGPKMGYLCLSAAWGKTEGIGVDVHVHRITNLWGWHKTKSPEETRAALEAWLPRERWHEINHLLVGFGQTVCLPVGRKCGECTLGERGLCPSAVAEKKTKIVGRVKKEVKKERNEVKAEVDVFVKEENVLAED